MKTIGIITEYNPIHLGHIYQINKIKKLYPESIIIVITSSCFTQRGDINILNKWDKTKICLENNEKRKGTRSYVPRSVIRRMATQLSFPGVDEPYFEGIFIAKRKEEE